MITKNRNWWLQWLRLRVNFIITKLWIINLNYGKLTMFSLIRFCILFYSTSYLINYFIEVGQVLFIPFILCSSVRTEKMSVIFHYSCFSFCITSLCWPHWDSTEQWKYRQRILTGALYLFFFVKRIFILFPFILTDVYYHA